MPLSFLFYVIHYLRSLMDILIRQATIIDPSSPFHFQKADLFIRDGVIFSINQPNTEAEKIIDIPGLFVSPGWVDLFSNFCDPGYEFKETLETGTKAAAWGGYTDVFVVPNTTPVLQSKASIEYIVQKGRSLPVTVHPIGAITKNAEGKDLAEMYDMEQSGAIAFSDGLNAVQSSGVLLKALQYIKAINKTIIQMPDDKTINPHGLMNEGIVSTGLGLPGKPAIAEELMIARDIELTKYSGSKLHFTAISTKKGIELIKKAKADGINITCSVTPYHLLFCDEDLAHYDTNLKVNPPLRTVRDRDALKEAVLDGTIDCIASHHSPQDLDNKVIEFENAKNGMIGLQTAFAIVNTVLPKLTPERLVELFSTNTRSIFDLPIHSIQQNSVANLSIFTMKQSWVFEKRDNLSNSSNSPFFGKELVGKPLGIINKDKLFLNQ
jgi:dihydroorotase